MTKPGTISISVENFAVVTHKVPAERVLAHLPPRYELETFDDGSATACFVSATCFCNRDFRPSGVPYPRHSFNETTYRTYVRYRDRRAVFFFGRYLGTPLARFSQRVIDRNAYLADFELSIDLSENGYVEYECAVRSDNGDTAFSLEAGEVPPAIGPFGSSEEHAQFLTYRLDGHFVSSIGAPAHSPVEHPRMDPYFGSLKGEPRFDLWDELEIVPRSEGSDVFSVLITPSVHFYLYPPRPAL